VKSIRSLPETVAIRRRTPPDKPRPAVQKVQPVFALDACQTIKTKTATKFVVEA